MARGFLLAVGDDVGLEQYSTYGLGGGTGGGGLAYPDTTNAAALASAGWRAATGAWAQQLCSPTRATIQTGVYPFRHGVGDLVRDDFNNPADQDALPENYQTIAETFLAAGYRTACFGKWHMGNSSNGGKFSPQRAGYEIYVGNLHNLSNATVTDPAAALLGMGGQTYYDWLRVSNGDTTRCRQFHITHCANLAIDFIRRCKARDEDWFLYLPFFGSHTPYSVPPTDLYDSATWGDPPAVDIKKFKALTEAVDTELGRILEEVDYADDTVVFLTDNGTGHNTLDDGTFYEYNSVQSEKYLNYYTRGDGKREYRGKDSPFETGVRVPLIVRGAGVTVSGNTASAGLFSVADIYPTLVELAGLTMPEQPCDGISFVPLLQGTSYTGHEYIYTEWFSPTGPNTGDSLGNRAITDGTYKLIRGINDGGTSTNPASGAYLQYSDVQTATGTARLYNLSTDWREETDLAASTLTGADLTAYNALDAAMADLLASDGL